MNLLFERQLRSPFGFVAKRALSGTEEKHAQGRCQENALSYRRSGHGKPPVNALGYPSTKTGKD
jgi:hypothetical protein